MNREPGGPADVVIAGYGPAGAAAAIAAHDAGASVLVVESTAEGGGNARYSGGFLFDIPGPAAADHLDALCFGRTPRPVLDAYAAGLHGLDGWLHALGGATERFDPPPARLPAPFPSWPYLPGGHDIGYRVVAGGTGRRGQALWDVLDAAVRERGIKVRYQTAASRLVLGPDGTVTGLTVRPTGAGPAGAGAAGAGAAGAGPAGAGAAEAGPAALDAAGGVVLACGGFEADPGLAAAYLPLGPTWPVGHPGNDGTGLRLAQQAGAALWHMYGCFGWFAFRTPDFPAPFAVDFFAASHLYTDADGRRFGDETGYEVHDRLRALLTYLPRNPNRPHLPAWAIFDEAARLAGPLNGLLGTPNDYTWSTDNAAEVARGWIKTATSPAGLAAQIGVDPAVLAATLDEYNAAARAGRDDRFGRAADTLVPLDTTRLYAIETWPGIAGTTGGPQHDEQARVLRPGGQPIPGLYAAGAVSLVWGHLIEHGGGLTDALVFGQIAGAGAAARAASTPAASTPAASTQSASTQSASTQSASTQSASTQSASTQSASTGRSRG